ncbi:MAG: sugar phosphate isomerase/epimerase [Bryobacterales bacterium]|nr:sugar phosphate isomerase/epimerase [Bryobacterales bacterium]
MSQRTQSFAQSLSRRAVLAGLAAPALAKAASRRTTMGIANDSTPSRRGITTLDFIALCSQLGVGGAQCPLLPLDAETARKVRDAIDKLGIFLVVNASINDLDRFRQIATLAVAAGASVLRVASGGRRYEDFNTLAERQAHVTAVRDRLRAAIPIAEQLRLPIGLENHKDFTADEQVALYKEYSSEFFGCCVDTGNNMALLEDPMETLDKLAPYAVTSHLKDATLEEYDEGFLLGDIPLGEGMIDLKRVMRTLRQRRASLPILLECITRNPLKIPCLTDKYWATFPDRRGIDLARMLKLVRASKPRRQLAVPAGVSQEDLRRLETENIELSVAYARDTLAMV